MSSTPKINLKRRKETILETRAAASKKIDTTKPKSEPVPAPVQTVTEEEVNAVLENVVPQESTVVVDVQIPQEAEIVEPVVVPQPETCEIRDGAIVCPSSDAVTTVPLSGPRKDSKSRDYDKILNICNSGICSIQANVDALRSRIVSSKSEFKSLNDASKHLDNIRKFIVAKKIKESKSSVNGDDRKKNMNSGFLKKKQLTQETIDFFALDNEPRSRVDMTRLICSYVRDKQLQDPNNRKQIILDEPLKTLLRYEGSPAIPYFDIQKHFNIFFVKDK